MLWCHLQSVFCLLTIAAVSGSRKRPHDSPDSECGPSHKIGAFGQPCTTKGYKTRYPPSANFVMLFEKKFGRHRVIDGPIRLMDGTEVEVCDSPVYDKKGFKAGKGYTFGKMIHFMRYLSKNCSSFTITIMNLKNPSRLVASQLNSSEWDLDHESLVFNGYAITMIEEMFTYGVAEMSENAAAKVLVIGLGGGYINSYLHRNYRRINITVVEIDEVMLNISKKWFGLNLDNRQQVIIEDGVEYVKRVASDGETFNVIYLDACTMNESAPVNCPPVTFLAANVVQSFSALLGPRGILVINVMAIKSDSFAAFQMVKEAFDKSFKYCYGDYAPFAPSNMFMTCAQFDSPSGLKQKYQQWKGYSTAELPILTR